MAAALRVRVRRSRVQAKRAAVRTRQVQLVQAFRRVQEWAEACLLQARPNRQDAQDRNRAARDSVISKGLKKAR